MGYPIAWTCCAICYAAATSASGAPAVGTGLASPTPTNGRGPGPRTLIGIVAPGAYADRLLTPVDPLANLAGLADPDRSLELVVRAGRVIVER